LVLLFGLVCAAPIAVAHAQSNTGGANANASATATATVTAAATDTNPAMTTTGSGRSATGYGYSDHGAPRGGGLQVRSGQRQARPVVHTAGPVATLPGFEMLAEGGSRLFVELTQSVQVEERRARGSLGPQQHEPARDGPLQHTRRERAARARGS
jgi:hypothetical protein